MYVRSLSLRNFRSYAAAELQLEPGITTLLGRNGAGKTNLIEAINFVATLGSHRVAQDAPMVRAGAASGVVRAEVVSHGRSMRAELEIWPGRANRARLNGSPQAKPRELLGLLRVVLFAPEDLSLVKGDPADRRRFLDDLLIARLPRYAGVKSDYDRVLRQRNALLKSVGQLPRAARNSLPTLDAWDASLARLGAQLLSARLHVVSDLQPRVGSAYAAMTSQTGTDAPGRYGEGLLATMEYRSSVTGAWRQGSDADLAELDGGESRDLPQDAPALEAVFLRELSAARVKEMERGISLVGPHRDELILRLGRPSLPAKGYASHGESWSLALAMRLGSYELLRADGVEPVLLLDDVLAELDVMRRRRLGELVSQAEQVIVTAADPGDLPDTLADVRVAVPGDVAATHMPDPMPDPKSDPMSVPESMQDSA